MSINKYLKTMGKPGEQTENTGLSGNAGNATGKNLFKGKLKDTTWYVLVGVGIAIAAFALAVVIF